MLYFFHVSYKILEGPWALLDQNPKKDLQVLMLQ